MSRVPHPPPRAPRVGPSLSRAPPPPPARLLSALDEVRTVLAQGAVTDVDIADALLYYDMDVEATVAWLLDGDGGTGSSAVPAASTGTVRYSESARQRVESAARPRTFAGWSRWAYWLRRGKECRTGRVWRAGL